MTNILGKMDNIIIKMGNSLDVISIKLDTLANKEFNPNNKKIDLLLEKIDALLNKEVILNTNNIVQKEKKGNGRPNKSDEGSFYEEAYYVPKLNIDDVSDSKIKAQEIQAEGTDSIVEKLKNMKK